MSRMAATIRSSMAPRITGSVNSDTSHLGCLVSFHTAVLMYINRSVPLGTCQLCRTIACSGQNPKIVFWKSKGLRAQTFLFAVICDSAAGVLGWASRLPSRGRDRGARALSTDGALRRHDDPYGYRRSR